MSQPTWTELRDYLIQCWILPGDIIIACNCGLRLVGLDEAEEHHDLNHFEHLRLRPRPKKCAVYLPSYSRVPTYGPLGKRTRGWKRRPRLSRGAKSFSPGDC